MPELLVPVIVSAAATAGTTITATTATIAAYAITAAAVAGIEYGASLFGDDKKTDVKQNYKQALPARVRAYGYCKLGGAYYFADKAGSTLVLGFIHCEGPIDEIVEYWLGDVQVTGIPTGGLDGISGLVPGKDKLLLDAQLGTVDQASNPGLTSLVPSWGPSRRLAGLANTVMRCYLPSDPSKNFQVYYPSGVPPLRVVCRTALVYDPRDGGTRFAENLGLAIRDYLLHPDGGNLPAAVVDDASFGAYATVCDGLIAKADGSNEPRYRIGQGTYDLTERKADVLKRLLAAGDARLYALPSGKIGIRGGVWVDPTAVITAGMVLGYTYQAGADLLTAYDQLRIRYIDQNLDYQQVEGDPWVRPGATGDVAQDFDARVVPSYNQARRLAKIKAARENPAHILQLTCTIAAIDAWGEATVRVQLPELGLDETFAINRCEIGPDGTTLTLDVSSLDASAYQWDPSQEGNGAPNTNVPAPPATIPAVGGLVLALSRTSVQGGVTAAQIRATVDPPSDTSYALHAQYRPSGGTWVDMTVDGYYTAVTPIVSDGAGYDVQCALQAYGGQDGAWSQASITVEVDTTAPGTVIGLSAAGGSGQATVSWTAPGVSNVATVRLYRATGAGAPYPGEPPYRTYACGPNQAFSVKDAGLGANTYRYWAVAANGSGVAGPTAGPADATVT